MISNKFFPLLPIRDAVVFPFTSITFKVGRDFSIKAIEESLKNRNREIILVTQKNSEAEVPEKKEMFKVGTLCNVLQVLEGPGDVYHVFIEGIKRVFIGDLRLNSGGYFEVEPFPFKTKPSKVNQLVKARKLFELTLSKYFEHLDIPDDIINNTLSVKSNAKFIDIAASIIRPSNPLDLQPVLESNDVGERFSQMTAMLKMEMEIRTLEADIESSVREKFEKGQKEFFINEHINALKSELSRNSSNPDGLKDDLAARIEQLEAPLFVIEKLKEELQKYESISSMNPESSVIRNYIETVLALPWKDEPAPEIDIVNASAVLENDHFGLEEVKKRILEYLAVLKLKGDLKSPIICLVGPPGVGKTSVASSIARATGRKFIRQSLGGIKDEAEIRGHRRTYVGAMPGKIIQSIKKVKTRNPLFLLDEIDKLGSDYKGDPSSALLEVLDPEQNTTFTDHFLDLEFDLSKVLFVATANDVSMIPPALRDRMEIIEIDGYTWYEKKNIALNHLIEKQKKLNGINGIVLKFTNDGIDSLIEKYTYESGVRELERKIAAICRKIALKKASGKESTDKVVISSKNIVDYLGVEKYSDELISKEKETGVVNGLAWTPYGGTVLKIEAIRYPGKGEIKITGHLGEVMRESVEIAVSYVKSLSEKTLKIDTDLWDSSTIHVHFPEGATPKDGPSAGVAVALAVASMMSGFPVYPGIAMTGEITLRGKVLKIGGLKAKIMAANRSGIKKVFIPADNKAEFTELPSEIRKGIEAVFVKSAHTVILECLENMKKINRSQVISGESVWQ